MQQTAQNNLDAHLAALKSALPAQPSPRKRYLIAMLGVFPGRTIPELADKLVMSQGEIEATLRQLLDGGVVGRSGEVVCSISRVLLPTWELTNANT